jgi:hypothetical protein
MDHTKKLLKLLENYIDEIQYALSVEDYRRIESETDNVCALLANLKGKAGWR